MQVPRKKENLNLMLPLYRRLDNGFLAFSSNWLRPIKSSTQGIERAGLRATLGGYELWGFGLSFRAVRAFRGSSTSALWLLVMT